MRNLPQNKIKGKKWYVLDLLFSHRPDYVLHFCYTKFFLGLVNLLFLENSSFGSKKRKCNAKPCNHNTYGSVFLLHLGNYYQNKHHLFTKSEHYNTNTIQKEFIEKNRELNFIEMSWQAKFLIFKRILVLA